VLVTGAGIVLGTAIAAAAGSLQSESAGAERRAGSDNHSKAPADVDKPDDEDDDAAGPVQE